MCFTEILCFLDFLSTAKPKDLVKIYDFLQSGTIDVANAQKVDDKYKITIVGLEEIFEKQ